MYKAAPCSAKHLNHVGIVVRDIESSLKFYEGIFGVDAAPIQVVEDQGIKAALVAVGGSQLEFIQPTDSTGTVARFVERRGEGLHHICFEVDGLEETLGRLQASDVDLIDHTPRVGISGMIAFLHPRATGGVLVELVERSTTER